MSIYDDVMACEELLNQCYDLETGEVDEEQEALAQELKLDIIAEGAEKLCKVRANFKSEIDALKAEENRLAEKRKSLEKKIVNIEDFIEYIWRRSDTDKLKAGTFTVSMRLSEAVKLEDNFENKDYGRYEFKADKVEIKKALKSGIKIDGAEIVVNENLQIK